MSFNLKEIMIAVIVTAIIMVGVSATVLGLIPWTQDNDTHTKLQSISMAQEAARMDYGEYTTYTDLRDSGFLKTETCANPNCVGLSVDKKEWVAQILSQSGKCWRKAGSAAIIEVIVPAGEICEAPVV